MTGALAGTSAGPLSGRIIVVTRPRAQAGGLAASIAEAGGEAVIFPLLEIGPAADTHLLDTAVRNIGRYALAIFISPNAVDYSVPPILAQGPWPRGLVPAAVGQGTVRSLTARGVFGTVAPAERFDSETLLDLPELQAERLRGRQVVIFRGDGGRELLAETLRARGARVDCIPCYSRSAPTGGALPLLSRWKKNRLDALTVSSSEGLRHLVRMLDAEDPPARALLVDTPLFVPHARIAENAKALGLTKVILTGPADAGIIAGLCKYNWRQS